MDVDSVTPWEGKMVSGFLIRHVADITVTQRFLNRVFTYCVYKRVGFVESKYAYFVSVPLRVSSFDLFLRVA